MKIALAQINCTAGDLNGNPLKILHACQQAREARAKLVITPEMALCGSLPEDWLLRAEFVQACHQALMDLATQIHDVTLVIGHPHRTNGNLLNAVSVIRDGRLLITYGKNHLLTDPLLDERRYFTPGNQPCTFECDGTLFGLTTFSDYQHPAHLQALRSAGAQVLLTVGASPYAIDGQADRLRIVRAGITQTGLPTVYTNLVGGQDELVFDGASFAMDHSGKLVCQLAAFQETLGLIELHNNQLIPGQCSPLPDRIESVYSALRLGLRDFIDKNRISGVLIGLSGGVDSALVLAIAVDALGADRVSNVMMPSPYTADISLEDAQIMAGNLGVHYTEIHITELFEQFKQTLHPALQTWPTTGPQTTMENLQARIRGTLLMALANQSGRLVLTTSNKSETAVGYSTLYGDMAGGFSILKDVSKTLVYQLCHYRNRISPIIPERILQRPPSAELRPDQTDQDNLPPYAVLDAIIAAYVENNLSPAEIIAMNYPEETVRQVLHMIHSCEYKRRQAAPGIRITRRDFGPSWRFPITSGFRQ
ncbi:NAD+ synthase (glutamine-hydrolysing) [Nitrosomonas eutropha]|uniref:NAD+ synthase n=1 Tax=Nitrosomonas eutropha TaxID=916 RepID=UPI00088907ED|nr:NAD+ synthase [Nitrosomonas eutropha]SCX11455.1 NAD+ synthase (glutamine-hydrolysing) [Nitrosomonas eutropha]